MTATGELVVRESNGGMMPAMTIKQSIDRYNDIVNFTKQIMQKNKDYGVIPGTDKPTLLKPGAEKLCSFFGLAVDYVATKEVEDWENGFFYFSYKAVLTRQGETIAAGIGSCNSKEKKYRWRNADRKCPRCGKETILRSKNKPEWYCWTKKGGCGANFDVNDPAITQQVAGRVENTETYDLVNTIQKMAQKRALVAATLIAANASEFFTQDAEDMAIIEGEVVEPEKPQPQHNEPLATVEQVIEIKNLLGMVRLPEGMVEKWFAKAGADSFEDMPAASLAKCIEYVRNRLPDSYATSDEPFAGDPEYVPPDGYVAAELPSGNGGTATATVEKPKRAAKPKSQDPLAAAQDFRKFMDDVDLIAANLGMDVEQLDKGVKKFIISKGLKGKEYEMNAADRAELMAAVQERRGYFAAPTAE